MLDLSRMQTAWQHHRNMQHSATRNWSILLQNLTWVPVFTVTGIIVAAAKLAGDAALATRPLAGSAEGAAPQPALLPLHGKDIHP